MTWLLLLLLFLIGPLPLITMISFKLVASLHCCLIILWGEEEASFAMTLSSFSMRLVVLLLFDCNELFLSDAAVGNDSSPMNILSHETSATHTQWKRKLKLFLTKLSQFRVKKNTFFYLMIVILSLNLLILNEIYFTCYFLNIKERVIKSLW